MDKEKDKNLLARPPIVVVLGHVDHGKTTLLDYIKKTNVVAKEAGGITQSTGAYEITHAAKKITFIDTPGHEAFSKMRQRGAKVADLGILVVAADESVKPQTKEAIKILQESQTLFVVAINKIDKNNADIERVKTDLMQAGVLLEGFGGNISWQAISSKTGEGVNELLDLILLAAELEGLTYNPEEKASGVIIESEMDSRRGLSVAVVVKNGVLRMGDDIATSSASGKVKILENFLGERVNKIIPSGPALVLGFETLPQTGEEFYSGKVEIAEILASRPGKQEIVPVAAEKGVNARLINLVLKADVSGSLEALSEIIKVMPEIKIISGGIGDITDGDVKHAQNTKAAIIGFKVRINKAADNLAKAQGIKIIASEIIYELIKNLEEELKGLREPVINGQLEVLAVFDKKPGKRQVIGGRVAVGNFNNNLIVKIKRGEQIIGQGKILNLQCKKQDIGQVNAGEECGILLEADVMVRIGDQLIY